jgi:SAM-dependent methyltransferase
VSGGWEDWEWDETLFRGAAGYYDRGRLPYSPALVDAFEAALSLNGTGRLLDVGCGPGTIALRIAGLFAGVVGVDADADMIAVAQRAAAILDGDDRADDDTPTRVRNHPGEVGSNAGSNRGARPDQAQPDGGP